MTETAGIHSLAHDEARQWLIDRLSQSDRPGGAVPPSIQGLDGFLFAVTQAPVAVSASDWLGEVLPLFGAEAPGRQALNALLSYQRHLERHCEDRQYPIPETAGLDAIEQIQPGRALNDWSRGFELGFARVESIWRRLLPTELGSELDSQLFALGFFASPDRARDFLAGRESGMRPEQLADQVLAQFPRAVDLHARLSMSIAAVAQAETDRVGRNDPCPCGSGKKFKHCCLQ